MFLSGNVPVSSRFPRLFSGFTRACVTLFMIKMDSKIEYQILNPEQFQEAVKLFNNHFLSDEPSLTSSCRGADHLPSDLKKMEEAILSYMEQNLSWCAVDAKTGKMVGEMITYGHSFGDVHDSILWTSDDYVKNGWSRHFGVVMSLVDRMLEDSKKVLLSYNDKETQMLELFAVGVHHDYRGRYIASKLVSKTLEHAVTLGYTFATVQCTSLYSQKLFERQGFEKISEEKYASYVDPASNEKAFKGVQAPHQSIINYGKKL